jgi:hypothetical protein
MSVLVYLTLCSGYIDTLLFGNQVLARVAVNSDGNMFGHHAVTFPLMHATGFSKTWKPNGGDLGPIPLSILSKSDP